MATNVTDPVTGIVIPTPLEEPGPQYAYDISNALLTLAHLTHTGVANQDGYQIGAAGLNIQNDLSIQNNNLTGTRSIQLNSQSAPLSGVGDVGSVYVSNGNLYYNNLSGQVVQITSGTTLDVAVPNNLIITTISANLVIPANATYNLVNVHSLVTPITITLPLTTDVASGRMFYIKDIDGYAYGYNITIRPESPDTIDGAASVVMSTGLEGCLLVGNDAGDWELFPYDKSSYSAGDTLVFNEGSAIGLTGSSLGLARINLNNDSQITLAANATLLAQSGSSLTVSAGSDLFIAGEQYVESGGVVQFASGSNLIIGSGAQENVNSGGEININSGGEINVASGGEINVASGGSINMADGYLNVSGGTTLNGNIIIPNNSSLTFSSGGDGQINLNGANIINLGSTSSINNLGSSVNASWPTWATPVSRSLIQPVVQAGESLSGTWTNLVQGVSDNSTGSTWVTSICRTQNGGTLSSVVLTWNVDGYHSISPITLPSLSVIRYAHGSELSPIQLSTTATQFLPTPSSGPTYYNGGAIQTLTYTCNQNNVIDNTLYYYVILFTDESGTHSLPNNNIYSYQLNYTNIPDQSWEV